VVQRQHRRLITCIDHADERGLGRLRDETQRDERRPAHRDGGGESVPARLPDEGGEGGDENDHGQQCETDCDLAGQQRRPMREAER
jgi:hypothetical protein